MYSGSIPVELWNSADLLSEFTPTRFIINFLALNNFHRYFTSSTFTWTSVVCDAKMFVLLSAVGSLKKSRENPQDFVGLKECDCEHC